jgi:hypothetical protein
MFEAGAFGSIGPASPVFDQRTRVMQTDPFGLVDQTLQLGPLCFGNRTLIVLIKQGGYFRLKARRVEKAVLARSSQDPES